MCQLSASRGKNLRTSDWVGQNLLVSANGEKDSACSSRIATSFAGPASVAWKLCPFTDAQLVPLMARPLAALASLAIRT